MDRADLNRVIRRVLRGNTDDLVRLGVEMQLVLTGAIHRLEVIGIDEVLALEMVGKLRGISRDIDRGHFRVVAEDVEIKVFDLIAHWISDTNTDIEITSILLVRIANDHALVRRRAEAR